MTKQEIGGFPKVLGMIAVIALCVFLGWVSLRPNQKIGEEGGSPHLRAYETELELGRQEKQSLEQRRKIVSEKMSIVNQRLELLDSDFDRAQLQFEHSISSAISAPRQRAEELISAFKIYLASEAVFDAQAGHSSQTAGFLGAINAQPLPYPNRNYNYADSLHRSAMAYTQALRQFQSDATKARLDLDREVTIVVDEFLALKHEVTVVRNAVLETEQLERAACERAIALAKALGPFMTHDQLPKAPSVVQVQIGRSIQSELIVAAKWIEEARVNSEAALRHAIDEEFTTSTFVDADLLVQRLFERGLP